MKVLFEGIMKVLFKGIIYLSIIVKSMSIFDSVGNHLNSCSVFGGIRWVCCIMSC